MEINAIKVKKMAIKSTTMVIELTNKHGIVNGKLYLYIYNMYTWDCEWNIYIYI